ncbi:MAG: formate dehydrogenase subunit alpha [Candidatus Nanopelagicaceae bacterium]|nr:formate dehydrogenase subunit alpha [Candidatus Nanopelagicaceae bacterium]
MTLIMEPDYGTPASKRTELVHVEIDGIAVDIPAETSIMRASAIAGISIPKLCATDSLNAFGSCRLCVVEIDGRNGTPSSCTTPVAEGMKISTNSERIDRIRQGVMELYLSDHPAVCASGDECEVHGMAKRVGLSEVRYSGSTHLDLPKDESNPYFTFDSTECIVCNRCVRACDEVQGTFALTIENRGFEARVSSSGTSFIESECVSCGACVQACPTGALTEKTLYTIGTPTRSVITTCAYCGVGCSFKAEMRGDELVRMVPYKEGGANEGHSCVKGRFAWGYATHEDRITKPMIREKITDPWKTVSWQEAIGYAASRLKTIQSEHGNDSIGGITSSRCTNEEVYVVQKMVRAAMGNNNVDTCARVCHSPTGYGLSQTFGTSAGTQDFESVEHSDVIMLIGANPTAAHPVFAARMKQALRKGAQLIVVDPRVIELVRTPHVEATHHLQLMPGTNVAIINALAHVIAHEGLIDRAFVNERCDLESFARWEEFIRLPENSPESLAGVTRVPAEQVRAAARLFASVPNGAIYYGLGVTEHSQGSTMVMGIANLAMATGNIGRPGVGVNPLRGQNNVQGSCDMGSFPHELPGYRHISNPKTREIFENVWGRKIKAEPGLRIPNMFDAAISGEFKGLYVQGEDIAQSDPNTSHVHAALRAMELIIVQDLFLNETSKFAHVFLPGTSFLEKDGTFTNAERRINRVRPVMPSKTGKSEWEVTCDLSKALGFDMEYKNGAEIMDEIAATTPTFSGVSFAKLDELGSIQWPCNEANPTGTPVMHVNHFVRGEGRFMETPFVPTDERASRKFPLLLTTGRILSQYNVGAQTRRTANVIWHSEDILDIHESDAMLRGITDGGWARLSSRVGETVLKARITDEVPAGVVYTTFHFPESGANVITTDYSDWATNCPEYKVTAVEIAPSLRGPGEILEHAPHGDTELASLVRMANQIAANVPAHAAPELAVAHHIVQFWTPTMKERLLNEVDRSELSPIVVRALALELNPQPA